MSGQVLQKENEPDFPVKGRRVSIEELLAPVSNCDHGQLERNILNNDNEDLYDHELMERQIEDYNLNRKILLKSGSEGNSETSENDELIGLSRKQTESLSRWSGFDSNNLPNQNTTSPIAQNRPLLLMDAKRKSYTYKNRFGKEILMSKHRPNAENNENSGILVNSSMGTREIDEILAFLDEPSAGKKDNTKNKGKKRKTKDVTEKFVIEKTEARKPGSLVIDEDVRDKRIEETDLMMVKTTKEIDNYETALREAEFDNKIISNKSVRLQVPERIEFISFPVQKNTNIFFTRADSFPTLNEANMRDDYVDGKHRCSPQIIPKTDVLFNKKSSKPPAHDSGVNSPAEDSNKFMDESFTPKVIIVDEDPSTSIDDITKSHGISFFYDQGLEHRDGDEKKKREKSEQEEKSAAIVRDSALKTSHTIATSDFCSSTRRAPVIQEASIKTLFSSVSKETNDLYQRIVDVWDTFQNRGARPYIYECGKAF